MKKATAFLLVIVLLIFCSSPTQAVNDQRSIISGEDTVSANTSGAKIHFYLDNEKYYDVYDSDTCLEAFQYMKQRHQEIILENDLIKVSVQFSNDFSETTEFTEKAAQVQSAKTADALLTARQSLNSASKVFHDQCAAANLVLLSKFKTQSTQAIEYSPFITMKMRIEDINIHEFISLASDDRVLNISFSYHTPVAEEVSWETALTEIGAYDIVSSGTYTGEGVRVGVYEPGGVADTSHPNLQGKTIRQNNETSGNLISDHATAVASIIALMAPEAEIYVFGSSDLDDLSWFISSNCSIVNCSFGECQNVLNSDGTYSHSTNTYRADLDGLYDYHIRTHLLTVVKSAGNVNTNNRHPNYNPNGEITSPGYAYNAITVGGVDRVWSTSGYKITHHQYACYSVGVGPYVKPEVSAFFTVSIPNIGVSQGTSFAAPQVTACLALLGDRSALYINNPIRCKAAVVANAKMTSDYVADKGNFCDTVGAGCVNLADMMANYASSWQYSVPAGTTAGNRITALALTLNEGETFRIGFAWYMYRPAPTGSSGYITDYNIRVYNSSGSLVAQSSIAYFSTVEMLRYEVSATGSYTVVVYQASNMDANIPGEKIAMSYNH